MRHVETEPIPHSISGRDATETRIQDLSGETMFLLALSNPRSLLHIREESLTIRGTTWILVSNFLMYDAESGVLLATLRCRNAARLRE